MQVLAAALGGIAVISFAGHRYFPEAATSAALLLLLAVLLTSAFARPPDSIAVAVVAALSLDYFFIPPIGSITVRDRQGWVALLVFLVTSVSAGKLANRFQRQQTQLIEQGMHTENLHALSRSLLMSGSGEEVKRSVVNNCMQLFDFEEFALFEAASDRLYRSQQQTTISDELVKRAAALQHPSIGAKGGWSLLAVTLGNIRMGSVAVRGSALPESILTAIANTVAIGLAHAQAQTASGQAEAVRKSEELKSLMIDALAHDLKSPLTAIEASAEMLSDATAISDEQRADLLAVIREESRGLRRLMEEAIHLARIDAEKLKLVSRPESLSQMVETALSSLGDKISGRKITVNISADLPPVSVDRELITQAVKQLLDNALKYAPRQAAIEINGSQTEDQQILSVRDAGPGLTEMEQAHVFDKFYRGRYDRSAVQGTGMGLAIAKEIVEAHGGAVGVRSRVGQGSEFYIALRVRAPQGDAVSAPL